MVGFPKGGSRHKGGSMHMGGSRHRVVLSIKAGLDIYEEILLTNFMKSRQEQQQRLNNNDPKKKK